MQRLEDTRLLNGVLVTRFGLPSLVVTLGTLALFRGLAYVILGGPSGQIAISNYPAEFTRFGFGNDTRLYSDGTVETRFGSTSVRSDGVVGTHLGASTLYTDGTIGTRVGNMVIRSDGGVDFGIG